MATVMFEHTFNEEHNLLIWRPTVEIDVDVAILVATSIAEIEKSRPPFKRFVDLTGIQGISLRLTDLQKIVDLRVSYAGPEVKAGHYAPHTLGFGIGRMYQAMMLKTNVKIEVFANIESCANWLDVPQKILMPDQTLKP